MTNQLGIKRIKFCGHVIEFRTNAKGQPCASHYVEITRGKNRGDYNCIESYYFKSEERRLEWSNEIYTKVKKEETARLERAEKLAQAKKEMTNPYKVGQVLYDSWGYDQTNVDFYQIVEVKNKSVVLREIGQMMVEGSGGFMCERVKPVLNYFKSENRITKHVKISVTYSGKIECRVNGLSEYTQGDSGVYQSHYA